MDRLPKIFLAAFLAWIAAVCGVRALDLARNGWVPSAAGEHRWYRWAAGNPRERSLAAALREEPLRSGALREPGADLVLRIAAEKVRPDWIQVAAQYAWPSVQVVGVSAAAGAAGAGGMPRSGARVLELAATETEASPRAAPPGTEPGEAGLGTFMMGAGIAFGAGWSLLHGLGFPGPASRRALLGLPLGLAVLAVLLWLLGLAGMAPRAAAAVLAAAAAAGTVATLGRLYRGARGRPPARTTDRGSGPAADRWTRLAEGVLVALLALFVWKVALAPVWSWDHFAIWGAKTRRLAAMGLEPGVLDTVGLRYSAPHYPLGLPAVWLVLSLGRLPGLALFKAAHVLFGGLTVLGVREAIRSAGGSRLAASALAAATAASPLLWDTESLGLADLPLALWAVAAAAALWEPSDARRLLPAGLALGFLPWIKQEGTVLAVLLGAALVVAGAVAGGREAGRSGRRRALFLGLPALAVAALAVLVEQVRTEPGRSFLAGDWPGRMAARSARLAEILGPLVEAHGEPQWLGLWVLFAVVGSALLASRLVRRTRHPELLLAAVVVGQLAVYAVVYLGTHLDPAAHIASSYLRISAALVPLAAVVIGAATARPRRVIS